MTKSLEARTKPEFYDKTVRHYRSCSMKEPDIAKAVAESIAEAKSLLAGLCPQCGAAVASYPANKTCTGGGNWVMYRCSTAPPPGQLRPAGVCDYMVDLLEEELAN